MGPWALVTLVGVFGKRVTSFLHPVPSHGPRVDSLWYRALPTNSLPREVGYVVQVPRGYQYIIHYSQHLGLIADNSVTPSP